MQYSLHSPLCTVAWKVWSYSGEDMLCIMWVLGFAVVLDSVLTGILWPSLYYFRPILYMYHSGDVFWAHVVLWAHWPLL